MADSLRDPQAEAEWSAMLAAFYLPTEGDVLLPFDGAGPVANATGDNWSPGNMQYLWGHRLPERVTDAQVRAQPSSGGATFL